jgi:hypothetical protein
MFDNFGTGYRGTSYGCGAGCGLGGSSLFGNFLGQHPWRCGGPGCGGSFYGSIEYLHLFTRGMRVPALATTSPAGTPINEAGRGGLSTTTYLLGPDRLSSADRSGGRVRLGYFFDPCGCRGVEFEYFGMGQSTFGYDAQTPEDYDILARPFYNTLTGTSDAQLIGYPGLSDGSLSVRGTTDFQGVGILFRHNFLCGQPTCCDPFASCGGGLGCGSGGGWFHGACDWLGCRLPGCSRLVPTRVDGVVGWRMLRLDETLEIQENLTSTGGPLPVGTTFDIEDAFHTQNTFHGVVLGTDAEWIGCGRVGFNSNLRVSLGRLWRRATIDGATTTTVAGGGSTTEAGGLLALPSNIGTYDSDQFVAVPEVGVNAFYMLKPNLRLTAGYTFMFLADVWRPGDKIDTNIDPRQLPPPTVAAASSPEITAGSDDFWAHGISLGLECRY